MTGSRPYNGAAAMRRLPGILTVLCILVPLAVAVPAAGTATTPGVRLTLAGQSPWVTPEDPRLHLRVRAVNLGTEPVSDLWFGITVFTPARTRTQYERSLTGDPPDAGVLFARFERVPGEIGPGQAQGVTLAQTIVDYLGRALTEGDETAVYPMKVELRSGDETVAALRSPIVFLNFANHQHVAATRLRLGWAFVLHHPIDYFPDGTFRHPALQDDAAPTGRLAQEVHALDQLANDPVHPRPVDVVWSPTLLSQLQSMRHGYSVEDGETRQEVPAGEGGSADAGALLDALHRLAQAPLAESTAMPYTGSTIPSLIQAGLGSDLPVQLTLGRDRVQEFTGTSLATDIFFPPDGYIDQASLATLAARGVRTFILDDGLVARPPQPKEFAQPATAALVNSPITTVTGFVPDAGVSAILASPVAHHDVRLTVQSIIGELAQIWLEGPGIPRAVAMSFPDSLDVPGRLFDPLLRLVSGAPFLQLQKISAITKNFRPPPADPARLVPRPGPAFPVNYVDDIGAARAAIATYRSILVEQSDLPDRMEDLVLQAEGDAFARDPTYGVSFLGSLRTRLGALFTGIRPDTSAVVTLASGQGVVPLSVVNETRDRVRVQIRMVSVRLDPSAETQTVELRANDTTQLLFRLKTRTTGRFPVQVRVLTPSGLPLGPPHELVIRSTAYNLVALIITLGAALFLLLWWARRLLPRARQA